jgi:hypothetical protein
VRARFGSRDTVVGHALTGRAHIRALPPLRGAAQLLAVAVAAQLGAYATLFAQHIVGSGPGEGDPGGHPLDAGSRLAQ